MDVINDNKVKCTTERQQQFIDLYMRRVKPPQIASIMGISLKSVRIYTSRYRKKGLLPPVRHLEFKVATHRTLTYAELKVQRFVFLHEELFEVSSFVKYVDIDQVRDVVRKLDFKKKDVNMLIRLYNERKLFEETINILYDYESHNELSEEEQFKIALLKHKLRIALLKKLNNKNVPDYITNNSEDFFDNER